MNRKGVALGRQETEGDNINNKKKTRFLKGRGATYDNVAQWFDPY